MKQLLGFQLANSKGENIQGDPEDPTGLASFEVMDPMLALSVIAKHPGFLLMPIFQGDIEEPQIVFREDMPQKGVTHTMCRHCELDIEGISPYPEGEWRDRGNNTHCPDGRWHAPQRF